MTNAGKADDVEDYGKIFYQVKQTTENERPRFNTRIKRNTVISIRETIGND